MSELVNLTSVKRGSQPDRFFERILGWPICDGTCWVSIGGGFSAHSGVLGNVAGMFDVTGQSDYPRGVVHLEQIMDAPSNEDVRFLIVSAREVALVKRRCRNIVVDREPSSFDSWTGERFDLPARGLLSRVKGIPSRSRIAFPPAEVSPKREPGLPVSSQSTPTFVRVSNTDGFTWVIDEPVRDMLGRAVFVTEKDVFLGEHGCVHSRADGSQVRISNVADEETVPWRERRFHAYEVFSRDERNPDAHSHQSVPVDNTHITAGDPEPGEEPRDHDDQEGEVDVRVLWPLCSRADRRFRKWKDVVLGFFRLQQRGSPVTRRDECEYHCA